MFKYLNLIKCKHKKIMINYLSDRAFKTTHLFFLQMALKSNDDKLTYNLNHQQLLVQAEVNLS